MLVALFVLVLINVPIAVALGVIATVAMVAKSGPDSLLGAAVVLFEGATSFPLIAIPLFVLAGAIMNTSGISRRLIAFASALLGFIRGGLSMVNIGTSMFFAEISGSAVADVAALGLMALSYWFAIRYDYPVEEVFQLRRVWTTFKEAAWAFLLPIIILGGIFGGFVTATEGAGLAVAAALFIGVVIYRELDVRHLYRALVDGAVQSAVVMLLVATSALLGLYLTESRIPQALARSIAETTENRSLGLAMLNALFLLLGCFLHGAAAIILVVPIVLPIVNAIELDLIHFGLIVTLNLAIGQQTPPVASVLITACSIAKADVWEVTKVNVHFIAVLFVVLVLVTYVPIIPLALVELFYR